MLAVNRCVQWGVWEAAWKIRKTKIQKIWVRNFPGAPVVKNPPYNARDPGSIPVQGTKFPHAVGQLSPHATTTELAHLN